VNPISLAERLSYTLRRRGDVVAALRGALECSRGWILDFGGGDGRVATALAPSLGAALVVADVDAKALARAPRAVHPVRIHPRGALPFRPGSFDALFLVDVLHHIDNGPARLADLARLLRPGGRLLVVDFDARRRVTALFRLLARLGGFACRHYAPDEVANALREAGLAAQHRSIDWLRYLVAGRRE